MEHKLVQNQIGRPEALKQRLFPAARFIPSLFVGLMVLLLGLQGGWAASGVRDEAGFFSETARREAVQRIGRLIKEARQEVLVETLKELPQAERAGVDWKDKSAVTQRLEGFARAQRDRHRVSGIYVLLLREPGRIEVISGNEARRHGFSAEARSELLKVMTLELQARRFDPALLKGLESIEKALGAPRKSGEVSSRDPAESPATGILTTVLGLGVLLIFVLLGIRLLKAIFSSGASPYGAGGSPGLGGAAGGGGGFFRSMMGSLFGAAAGMWLYDQFFGHRSEGSFFDSRDSGSSGDSPMGSDESDAAGADIDFGSDSSSQNVGEDSGDSGGSDWGGGDWGGGGGDYGGDA